MMNPHFRPIRPEDEDQLRLLHEDWFPVRYKEAFYVNAVKGKMYDSDDPIFSVVAEVPSAPPVVEAGDTSREKTRGREDEAEVKDDGEDGGGDSVVVAESSRSGGTTIVGALLAHMVRTAVCGDEDLYDDPASFPFILYILTLGTSQAYRRQGIASALLQRCIEYANEQAGCGAVSWFAVVLLLSNE
jgi:ribosomal protein S18 acetylase RimI-like enzyme